MRTLLLTTLLLLFTNFATAQCAPHAELAYTAYLSNELTDWDKAIEAAKVLPESADNLFTLAHTAHAAATAAWVTEDEDLIDGYLDLEETTIDRLWELDEDHAAAHGLYSGYLGMLIARSPMKGMVYGSKSAKYARKGVELDPTNAAANYFSASNYFYTPTNWGGDNKLAVERLRVATEQVSPKDKGCSFLTLDILALYGQAQAKDGDKEGARRTYLEALKMEPKFSYVKYVLLPQLDAE